MRPIEHKSTPILYNHFLFSSFSLLKFSYPPFFWTYYLKKEWILCKILYISRSYFYFFSFSFSSSFSALYYILRKICRIAFLFINCCFHIVIIEEGAFHEAPFKILFFHILLLKRRQML